MSVNVILIEDDAVDELYPFALTQNSWQLRAGRYSIVERWRVCLPDTRVVVHSHRTLQQRLYVESAENHQLVPNAPLIVLMATAIVSPDTMRRLAAQALQTSRPCILTNGSVTVGAIMPRTPEDPDKITATLDATDPEHVDLVSIECQCVHRLWGLLDLIEDAIAWDASLVENRISDRAVVHPTAVIDESNGPVLIDDGAVIGAFALIQGPCSIGLHASVKPHAHITHSVIGPHCKVGGEISVSILHGYSNKQHFGFLGHSIIGYWVNLGAGTTTSNLKNTYHDVRPTMPWGRESSGRLFLGSMIGDFTRTAIGTMLPTGGVYGVCSHVMSAGLAPSHLKSFSWSEAVAYDRERAFETCDTMMKRRGLSLTDIHRQVLDDVRGRDV